jgi:DNA-binding transcriptional ArsR family regulator
LTFLFHRPIFNYMVEFDSQLDIVFRALSDSTRRGMLARLALGEQSVGELAEPFAMSFAGASKHVKVLEEAGLIRREVRGRTHICRLEPGPLASADQWLRHYERFWTGRLDALEQLLREDDARKAAARKNRTPRGESQ